jgi:hypothetical protein
VKIKFGNIELNEWEYSPRGWMRRVPSEKDIHRGKTKVMLYHGSCAPDIEFVRFWDELGPFQELSPWSIIQISPINAELIKEQVDQFLIRMSKLSVFI